MRPSFNATEEYLIASYRLQHQNGTKGYDVNQFIWLIFSVALAVVGIRNDDVTWILLGLALICIRVGQGMATSAKYNPVLASIIDK
jgi:hypothetical protein